MRMPRTQFGAKVTAGERPVVTLAIIVICVAVWLVQKTVPAFTADFDFWAPAVRSQPWRFLTSAFEHDTSSGLPLHILFNMYALWVVGQYVEPLLGRVRFAIIYLVCAFGGSVGLLMLETPSTAAVSSWDTSALGASGAIFGMFLTLLLLNRHLGRSTVGIGVVILVNFAYGFIASNVAWQAHLGGAITGAACGAIVIATARSERRRWQLPAFALLTALLVVLVVLKLAPVGPQYFIA
jgi:membrane associated rhomboid family serine protease